MKALDDQISKDASNEKLAYKEVAMRTGFKSIFIYFWVVSLLGHYWEITWATFRYIFLGQGYWGPTNVTIVPLAAPYGFGVIAIILFVLPLMKRYKLKPIAIIGLSTIVTGVVEYICAAVMVFAVGENMFWDYSNHFLNINGYVCLESALAFGIISTLYIYYLHPILANFLKKLTRKNYDLLFWGIFISYFVDLTYAGIRSYLI